MKKGVLNLYNGVFIVLYAIWAFLRYSINVLIYIAYLIWDFIKSILKRQKNKNSNHFFSITEFFYTILLISSPYVEDVINKWNYRKNKKRF